MATVDETPEGEAREEGRPGIWQLAIPSILGNLSFTVAGMVQTKFIGELGAQALIAFLRDTLSGPWFDYIGIETVRQRMREPFQLRLT